MDVSEAMSICFRNNTKVYPVFSKENKYQIEYSVKDIPKTRYIKRLNNVKEVNKAMVNTYIFIAKKLLLEKNKK
tara:strand:- start:6240 stop:6461 length:222 start_codon:yes stop_codon:yes gene_type:complete